MNDEADDVRYFGERRPVSPRRMASVFAATGRQRGWARQWCSICTVNSISELKDVQKFRR